MGARMSNSYKELIKSNPDETEIRSFLVNGDQVSVTLRIPDTLRDAAKEEAALRDAEKIKIGCAKKHFEALDLGNDFHYNVRTTYQYEAVNA